MPKKKEMTVETPKSKRKNSKEIREIRWISDTMVAENGNEYRIVALKSYIRDNVISPGKVICLFDDLNAIQVGMFLDLS